MTPAVGHDTCRERLWEQATGMLRALIAPGSRCALLDFPLYANVGDSAIWLGERALLREVGAVVDYVCRLGSLSVSELTSRIPAGDGVILLQGGGNLGDLWPRHQLFRERVISAFPGHRIIQLPQSLHFDDPANLARAQAVFDAHPDLTLLLRDRHSLITARRAFRARSLLCPDLAFGFDPPPVPGQPEHRVVWLSRTDHESAGPALAGPLPGVWTTDWAARQGATAEWTRELHAVTGRIRAGAPGADSGSLARLYDRHAELHVLRGCRLLCSGRTVITDRLHAHVLSLLLRLPHVLLADRNGKVREFWETWTRGWPGASWAETPEQALVRALGHPEPAPVSPSAGR